MSIASLVSASSAAHVQSLVSCLGLEGDFTILRCIGVSAMLLCLKFGGCCRKLERQYGEHEWVWYSTTSS